MSPLPPNPAAPTEGGTKPPEPDKEQDQTEQDQKPEDTSEKTYILGKDKNVLNPEFTRSAIEVGGKEYTEGDEVELTSEQAKFFRDAGHTLKAKGE